MAFTRYTDRDGTISGATYSTDNAVGTSSLDFDGVDDYVEIPHGGWQLGSSLSQGFTISAWINPRSLGETAGKILDKSTGGDIGGGGFTWRLATAGENRIYFNLNGGTPKAGAVNSVVYGSGNWYHILVTISSESTCTHYVNGVVTGTPGSVVQPISAITTTNVMRIGNLSTATTRTFDGLIDEVCFFNYVLSQAEISNLFNKDQSIFQNNNLIGYWKFDEGSGTTALNYAGTNSRDATSGQQEIKTKYPVVEGLAANQKHDGQENNLIAEEEDLNPSEENWGSI